MLIRKNVWIIFLFVFAVLSACSSDDKEFDTFLNELENDISGEDADRDKYVNEYIKQIENGEPEKALEILNEKEIPKNEELIEKYKEMDFDNEDLTELKEALTKTLELDKQEQETIRDVFEKVMDQPDLEELQIDKELEILYDTHKRMIEVVEDSAEIMKEVNEEYDQIEIDEENLESKAEMDVSEMNDETDVLIMAFIEVVADMNGEEFDKEATNTATQDNEEDDSDEEEEKEADSQDDESLKEMLADKGSTEVALDAEAEIKDNHFRLVGKSNLIEGSTVLMHTYHYGAENAYLKGEFEVDEDGSFEMEEEIDEESLNGEPLVIRLAFQPDKENPELQEIYGEEGEKLEGPFAHKFTSTKRTRYGAFTYADLELEEGAKTEFGIDTFEEPDDYGDMDIWMEKENVETKDDYYIITMNSNLNELTKIKAEATVPGYETAGYTSSAKVRPDGSIRIHVPRPEVEDENVVVEFEARSDGAIETEELYGEYGENFEGDLADKKKQRTVIEYELDLGEDS